MENPQDLVNDGGTGAMGDPGRERGEKTGSRGQLESEEAMGPAGDMVQEETDGEGRRAGTLRLAKPLPVHTAQG